MTRRLLRLLVQVRRLGRVRLPATRDAVTINQDHRRASDRYGMASVLLVQALVVALAVALATTAGR